MASQQELDNMTLRRIETLEPVEDIGELEGFAMLGYNRTNGAALAIKGEAFTALTKIVPQVRELVEALTPVVYYEDEWNSMTEAQQRTIVNNNPLVHILEGSRPSEGGTDAEVEGDILSVIATVNEETLKVVGTVEDDTLILIK